MLTQLFITYLKASVVTGVILLILMLLSFRLNRRYAAKWKYWVWLILAVRLLIPVNFSLPKAPVQIAVPQTQVTVPVYAPTANMPAAGTKQPSLTVQSELQTQQTGSVSAQSGHPARLSFTLEQILMLVWLTGFLIFMGYQLTAYRLFRKQALRWSRPAADNRIADTIARLCVEMNIQKQIRPVISDKVAGPMMTGFFKPVILLPCENYSETELSFILQHELMHYKRRDLWYKLLMLLTNAVHWFNPLVYWMRAQAGRDLELSCDDEVLKGTSRENRRQYSETILNSVERLGCRRTALSTHFYDARTIKKRILNIFSSNNKKRGIAALFTVLMLVCLTGGFVACRQIQTDDNAVSSDNETSSTQSSEPAEPTAAQATTSRKISNQTYHSGPADSGNTYTFDNHKLNLSYHNGETKAAVELPSKAYSISTTREEVVWMSDQITAVVYSGPESRSPLEVMISGDKGETWNTYTISMGSDYYGSIQNWIGFTSKNDGWILVNDGIGCGTQQSFFLKTSDGGKTWSQVGDALYTRLLSGAVFVNKDIGFLVPDKGCDSTSTMLYRTQDGGNSWDRITSPDNNEPTISCPYALELPIFDGAKGVLPVGTGDTQTIIGQYVTSDYGKTWTYQDSKQSTK